jgi:hypothetical protein
MDLLGISLMDFLASGSPDGEHASQSSRIGIRSHIAHDRKEQDDISNARR